MRERKRRTRSERRESGIKGTVRNGSSAKVVSRDLAYGCKDVSDCPRCPRLSIDEHSLDGENRERREAAFSDAWLATGRWTVHELLNGSRSAFCSLGLAATRHCSYVNTDG